MKQFVVVGLGSFGFALATKLAELGHEVIAIDQDADKVNDIANFVTMSAVAQADDKAALKSLGVQNADVAVVSLASDFGAALMCLISLKELGVPVVYTKAHTDQQAMVLSKLGSDKVLFPEREMGTRLAHTLVSSNIMDLLELDKEHLIAEIPIAKQWEYKSLVELNLRAKYSMNVIAIRRGETMIISPSPEEQFLPGDELIVIAQNERLNVLRKRQKP